MRGKSKLMINAILWQLAADEYIVVTFWDMTAKLRGTTHPVLAGLCIKQRLVTANSWTTSPIPAAACCLCVKTPAHPLPRCSAAISTVIASVCCRHTRTRPPKIEKKPRGFRYKHQNRRPNHHTALVGDWLSATRIHSP